MSTSRTYASLATLPAASLNDLAQGTLGYAQVTANQASISTVVDLTSLTVTVTVVAGRRIRITGQGDFQQLVAAGTVTLQIMEGATQLNQGDYFIGTASSFMSAHVQAIIQPSVGSHTYKLQARTSTNTTTLTASATVPAFILVEDIGI